MFGLPTKTTRPFDSHADTCRHREEEPEWTDDGWGIERRTCAYCGGQESRTLPGPRAKLDPATQSPEPAPSAHLHVPPSCPGVAVVVPDPVDGGWKSTCPACTSMTHYWWEAVYADTPGSDPVRVHRSGNVLYVYATADPNPPAAPWLGR